MKKRNGLNYLTACLAGMIGLICGEVQACSTSARPSSPSAEVSRLPNAVRVEVQPFATSDELNAGDGERIQELLTARLAAGRVSPQVRRDEQGDFMLFLGPGDKQKTTAVERSLVGKVGITGRAFLVGGQYVILSKIRGGESRKVFGVIVRGKRDDGLPKVVSALAKKLRSTIERNRDVLAPRFREEDRPYRITQALGGSARPGVLVSCATSHLGSPIVTPSAETQIASLLQVCGFKVVNKEDWDSTSWIRAYLKDPGTPIPDGVKEPIDMLVVGEAVSEFAVRIDELVSCRARVEVKAIDRRTGHILAVERDTTTAVDSSEYIAAKNALQEAVGCVCERLFPEATRKWNAAVAEGISRKN